MKKFTAMLIILLFLFTITGCSGSKTEATENTDLKNTEQQGDDNVSADLFGDADSQILVAYFSCTGNTKNVAQVIAEQTGAAIYEIEAEEPYSEEDLDYNTDCRANRENEDETARPGIKNPVENLENYHTIYLGYPIWWSKAPKIIYTFLENNELAGKTIIPFCTSGGSGIDESVDALETLTEGVSWKQGKRFSSSADETEIADWITEVGA